MWKPQQAGVCAKKTAAGIGSCYPCWSFASHQGEFLRVFQISAKRKQERKFKLGRQSFSAVCLMSTSTGTSKNQHLMATVSPCCHVLFNQYSQCSCEVRLFNPLNRWGNWESDTDLLEDIWLQKFGGAGVQPGWLNSNVCIFFGLSCSSQDGFPCHLSHL